MTTSFAHLVGNLTYLTSRTSDTARYAMSLEQGRVTALSLELAAERSCAP